MENIINLVYLVMSGLSLIVTISVLLKRKKTADNEEQQEINELIALEVKNSITNIQNTLKGLNIKCNNKTVLRTAKTALKESIKNGTTKDA